MTKSRWAAAFAALVLVPLGATSAFAGAASATPTPAPAAAGSYVVTSAPTQVAGGASSFYAIGVRDIGPSTLGTFRLAVPAGFTPHLPLALGVTLRGLWTVKLVTCAASTPAPCAGAGSQVIEADAVRSNGADRLQPGEVLVFAFTAKATLVGGTYPWLSAATASAGSTGGTLTATGTTPTIKVLSSAPVDLRLSGLPASTVAGTALSPTVTAVDAFGNPATGFRGTVHFDGGTSNPADYTFTAADAGTHTFNGLVLTQAPSQTVTVSDTADGLASAPSTVNVTAAAASSLSLTTAATSPAGSALLGQVTAYDPYGNIATGYTGTIGFSVSDGSAAEPLPDPYTFTPADQGTHPISVTLTRSGARVLTVDDGTLSASSNVTVTSAPAATLTLTPDVTTTQAGSTFGATVAVTDQYGNPSTDYTGTVQLSSDADGASLPATYTFTAADAGTHSFAGLSLTKAVATTLTATDAANPTLTGSAPVDVTPAPADHIVVSGPSSATAGDTVPVTLTALDPYGNVDTAYGSAVTFSCVGAGSAGSCAAPTTFSAGQADSSAVLTVAGSDSITATSGALSSSLAVTVAHAPAVALSLTDAPPASLVAGTTFGLTVSVVDGFNNVVTDAPSVPVTVTAGVAPFPVVAPTVGGVATFSGISVSKAGGYTLTAASPGLSDTGAPLTVIPGGASQVVVTGILDQGSVPRLNHPVVGQPFDTSVTFEDAQGNVTAVSSAVTLTLSKVTGTGALSGTTTVNVPAGATTATILGSFYSVLENSVTFAVGAPGLTAGTILTDIAGQAVTAQATPGQALPTLVSVDPITGAPCVLSATQATCSQFQLTNGASSTVPVYLFQTLCSNSSVDPGISCKASGSLQAQLVHATATLEDANGNPLYSAAHPATLIVSCYVKVCPSAVKSNYGYSNNRTTLTKDVAANPLSVTVYVPSAVPGGPATPVTGDATICAKTGVVDAGKYFCIDPCPSGRDAQGNYIQVLRFFDDPLAHNR